MSIRLYLQSPHQHVDFSFNDFIDNSVVKGLEEHLSYDHSAAGFIQTDWRFMYMFDVYRNLVRWSPLQEFKRLKG